MSTYTARFGKVVRELKSTAVVSVNDRYGDTKAPPAQVTALWDTGAYSSAISEKVVDALGLKPVASVRACGVSGWYDSPVFKIDLQLPNQIKITGLSVSLGKMVAADILIGMDVLSMSDFNFTNNGETVLSIRTPSEGDAPFVADVTEGAAR